jgi:precorrin-8X/cobalt-precorrin-8 methylmutase
VIEHPNVHPIEAESYRILASRLDLGHMDSGPRAVVERVIHASADLSYATTIVISEGAVDAGLAALAAGAPVVVDVAMVAAGITSVATECLLGLAQAGVGGHPTRSANAMRLAAERHPDGAVFVVGCAPTALTALIDLAAAGAVRPALVIGLPVGFVGAAESKEALRQSGLASISNVGEKGGSAVAAAALNALVRLAGAP